LFYSGSLVAILDFLLPPDLSLTSEQTAKFNGIAEDMAFALKNAHQRRSITEMQANKAVIEERLRIFRDLHDNLGQTLAFMCVKLSQLTQDGSLPQEAQLSSELSSLCSVAHGAYGQVRDALSTMRAENTGQLMNLIKERADMVAEKAKFKIDISTSGESRLLSPATIRQIVYIFREALANVERHAQARHVDVHLDWSEDGFVLRIADDGRGFDPRTIHRDQHFGLSIMQERVEKIDGKLILNAHPEKGTEILVRVPLSARQLAVV
jgi:two-component system nitrate/nitrite sensor histidine kinase NarX